KLEIDASEIAIVARSPFTTNDEAAGEIGNRGFLRIASLVEKSLLLRIGTAQFELMASPKPRIVFPTCRIANGPQGWLLGRGAEIQVHAAEPGGAGLELRLRCGTF